MADQRKRARAPLDIYLNKYIQGVPYMAKGADISTEGVSLAHLIEPQYAGKRVGLQFQLPGSEEVIYAEGEVVREWSGERQDAGSGIRFTLMTERHRKMVTAFVEQALARAQ